MRQRPNVKRRTVGPKGMLGQSLNTQGEQPQARTDARDGRLRQRGKKGSRLPSRIAGVTFVVDSVIP